MALDFGPHEDVVFARAPLLTVVCQVKFSPILSLLTQAGVTGFQTGLRDEYPILLPGERSASFEVGAERVGIQASAPVWKLADCAERRWTVGLSAEFVSLETSHYTHIDEFLVRLQRVLDVLRRTLRPSDSVRVGLRKVNIIHMPDPKETLSLRGVLRAEMLGPLSVEAFPAPVSAYAGQLAFNEDTYNQLVVRYGLGSPESDPAEPSFILDMDYFTTQPYEVGPNVDLLGVLRHYSEGITSFFHWAVEDDYKASLGPVARGKG